MFEAMKPCVSAPRREDVFARVFLNSSLGIAVVQLEDGRILEANDAFCYLLGRDRDHIIGDTPRGLGLFDQVDGEKPEALLQRRGVIDGFDAPVRTPGGETRVLRLWAEVIPGEEPLAIVRVSDIDGRATAGARYRELREAEVRYRALVEQVPALIYTEVTDDGCPSGSRATYVSPQSLGLLGYEPHELVDDPALWDDIVHPADRQRIYAQARAFETNGEPFCEEYRVVTKSGEVRWVHDEAAVIGDPVSGIRFSQGFMLDITPQKRAAEEQDAAEAKYQALIERIPAIVYRGEFGEDGDWLYISPQVQHVLGYTQDEWLTHPHPLSSFVHPDDLPMVRAEEERSYITGDAFRAEYRMRAKDGRWVWILDEAAAVRDQTGRVLFMQGLMHDMTERKRAEEQLAQALQRLRDLDGLKNTLLHTLSHDLKGPLTAILGAASTLERLDRDLPEGERRDLLHTLSLRTRGIDRLLTDLLDLERLDRGIVEPQRFPVDLGELVRELVARSDVLAGRRVEVDADQVTLLVDGPKIERMVENLLTNAAGHTPSESRIWVRVVREEHGATIIVDDEGPGVPDRMKDEIFQAFRRGPNPRLPGTGIGLSLVARFAEMHGGRAWVQDRAGGGASFRVALPALADASDT
jgi:PAS domain S-box-containing protein